MTVGEVALTLVLMDTYITLMILIGHLMWMSEFELVSSQFKSKVGNILVKTTGCQNKHMIGQVIKSLTCSTPRTRLKLRRLFETGVRIVGTFN